MSSPLPTPAEAMRQAVERAQLGDIEGGALWLGIARELRAGAMARPRPRPLAEPPARVTHFGDDYLLPICEQVAGDDPEGCLVSLNVPHVTCLDCLGLVKEREVANSEVAESVTRFGDDYLLPIALRRRLPALAPEYRSDETAVMTGFELPPCAFCGRSLVWIAPGPDDPQAAPYWAHDLTKQRVCLVSAPDQAHTFATPAVDARG